MSDLTLVDPLECAGDSVNATGSKISASSAVPSHIVLVPIEAVRRDRSMGLAPRLEVAGAVIRLVD